MKPDILFPPPPHYNQPPLPCSDIPPERQRALQRLSEFAALAEECVGMSLEGEVPFVGTARGFALHVFKASPFADELAALLARSKINVTAADHVDAPHVMLIDPRRYWGVLGPVRGDVVLFSDGHAAVVTKPLCMGCQHFEAVALTTDALPASDMPQIARLVHWLSTVKWILRLVDESEEAEPPSIEPPSSSIESSDNEEPSTTNQGLPASAETPSKRKRKITGI